MANNELSSILLLLLFGFLLCGQTLQQSAWMETFTADVAVQGYNMTKAGETPFQCSRTCAERVSCLAFAFSQVNKTCWLYDHLVLYYNLSGMAAPGTRYFWRLTPSCPSELGYRMQSGLCFRVESKVITWEQGRALCGQEGAHLFIADTWEKMVVVLQARRSVWIGASDLDEEKRSMDASKAVNEQVSQEQRWNATCCADGDTFWTLPRDCITNGNWRWVNGQGLPRRSPFWDRGEPNNVGGLEHCLELRASGFFNDRPAFAGTFRVACQIPVS